VEGTRSLPKEYRKDYFCCVVSEGVKIALKKRFSFSRESNNEHFVHCDQLGCQYLDLNQSPCPLNIDLFAEEIKNWYKTKTELQRL